MQFFRDGIVFRTASTDALHFGALTFLDGVVLDGEFDAAHGLLQGSLKSSDGQFVAHLTSDEHCGDDNGVIELDDARRVCIAVAPSARLATTLRDSLRARLGAAAHMLLHASHLADSLRASFDFAFEPQRARNASEPTPTPNNGSSNEL